MCYIKQLTTELSAKDRRKTNRTSRMGCPICKEPICKECWKEVTLSRLGAPLVRLLESSVHKSANRGPINMILSAKWVCYVLPIHIACSIMQIGPLVPKLQQVTGLCGQ